MQSSQPCKSLPSFVSFCCYFLFLNSIPVFCTWDPLIIIIPVSKNKPVSDSELPLLCAQINLQLTSWAHINKELTKLMVSVSILAPDALQLFKLHFLLHLSVSKRKQDVYGPEGLWTARTFFPYTAIQITSYTQDIRKSNRQIITKKSMSVFTVPWWTLKCFMLGIKRGCSDLRGQVQSKPFWHNSSINTLFTYIIQNTVKNIKKTMYKYLILNNYLVIGIKRL